MLTSRINRNLAATVLAVVVASILAFALTGSSGALDSAASPDPVTTITETPAEQNPVDTTTSAMTTGQILYDTHCAECHGTHGEGGSGGPVDDLSMSVAEIIEITANGAPRMPAYKDTLTDEEIQAVSEYTLQLTASN